MNTKPDRCPLCDSPDPARHPAVQSEGEVSLCPNPWHTPTSAAKAATVVTWPADIAIAACLRVMATDLENGTAEGFSPSCAAVEALEEGGPRSPHSEAGFRAWLDYYGGLSSEAIKAAVIAVQQKGEPA